jgi:hypothetical protein
MFHVYLFTLQEEKSRTDQMFSSDALTIEEVAYARGIQIAYICKIDGLLSESRKYSSYLFDTQLDSHSFTFELVDFELKLSTFSRVWFVTLDMPYKMCEMGSAADPFCPRCDASYHTV